MNLIVDLTSSRHWNDGNWIRRIIPKLLQVSAILRFVKCCNSARYMYHFYILLNDVIYCMCSRVSSQENDYFRFGFWCDVPRVMFDRKPKRRMGWICAPEWSSQFPWHRSWTTDHRCSANIPILPGQTVENTVMVIAHANSFRSNWLNKNLHGQGAAPSLHSPLPKENLSSCDSLWHEK